MEQKSKELEQRVNSLLEEGRKAYRNNDFKKAEETFGLAIEKISNYYHSQLPILYFNRGLSRVEQKKWTAALDDLKISTDLDENYEKAWILFIIPDNLFCSNISENILKNSMAYSN